MKDGDGLDRNQIKRSIYYYEWSTHSIDKDTNTVYIDKTSRKIANFLSELHSKQLESENYIDFIVPTSQGEEFFIIDNEDDKKICFRIVLCRENALPYIERGGKLEELGNVISDDQKIAEITHCVFFKDYGILGAEYNNNGARATSVSEYMIKISKTDSMPTCRAKLNYDVYSKLIQDETFTLFDFSIRANSEAYINILAKKSIFSALYAKVPELDTIEVVLRKRKTKNNKIGFSLPISFDDIKTLLTQYREDIKKFNISQGGKNESVDLLSDKFVGKVLLSKTVNRTIDSNEMYNAISSYFGDNVEKYCEKQEI